MASSRGDKPRVNDKQLSTGALNKTPLLSAPVDNCLGLFPNPQAHFDEGRFLGSPLSPRYLWIGEKSFFPVSVAEPQRPILGGNSSVKSSAIVAAEEYKEAVKGILQWVSLRLTHCKIWGLHPQTPKRCCRQTRPTARRVQNKQRAHLTP